MNLEPNQVGDVRPLVSATPPDERRRNWLRLARRAWIGLALLLLAYFVASVPVFYQTSLTVCTSADPGNCRNALVSSGTARALVQLHLSVAAYVVLIVALDVAGSVLAVAISVLIFWRLSREWKGLFFSLVLVVAGATQQAMPLAGIAVTASTPFLLHLLVTVSGVLNLMQSAVGAAFFLTFPTGRLTPRWSGLLIVLAVGIPSLPQSLWADASAALGLTFVLTYVAMIGIQVYRYARVYDRVQRQQTKWCIFALGIFIVVNFLPPLVTALAVPGLSAPDSWFQLLSNPLASATLVLLPLSIGIAILRYRLWDVDVLINRALVYGSLTASLVALYVELILVSQALVRALTGSLTQQPLVLVASTLAIAALFQPLRHRLQSAIDGRFYRRKYDAAQVVAAFSSTLRQEVDLDDLREQLVAVVQETMQPTRALVWLRPTDQDRGRSKINQSTFDVNRRLTPSAAATTRLHRPTTP